ncbi:hypothetical protein GH741_16675 [Aquibacillus halophilus]|uniref:Uncharacterized protein n=1 Tax=Aquibacillus halophilus TaxID=930132 RepID=A0A6A8DGC7_9BACI|nr:hypothetical protein [Aquibacillus halophilus]MRH44280.1 hypothetical protein [Aquibacillus halophilus]
MNANGMARGLMAKNLEKEKFLAHVLDCVTRKLIESDYNPEVITSWNNDEDCLIVFHVNNAIFSIKLKGTTISMLRDRNPYSLDQIIWKQLTERGIKIKEDNYIDTVFNK